MQSVRISVAMATFNGAKFLPAQLESLAEQISLPLELVVCDDGSTDETISIVESFAKHAPFPVRIYKNACNLGYAENFFKSANLCNGDWVSFCDQDDVWLPNKLSDVASAILKDSRPVMILQNAYLCNGDLTHRGRVFPNRIEPGYHRPRSQRGFWVWPGFVKTVKRSIFAFEKISARPRSYFEVDGRQTHDKWTCMLANSTGGFTVLGDVAALYRRHEAALTGDYASQKNLDKVKKSLVVTSDSYTHLSEVARESSEYLEILAQGVPRDRRMDFRRSAHGFSRMEKILRLRSQLYKSRHRASKAWLYLRISANFGYFGPRMSALGWKSAAKDVAEVLGVLSSRRERL